MNALRHDFDLSAAHELAAPPAVFADKWEALHDAAAAVAGLAQLAPEKPDARFAALPSLAASGPAWRLEVIERGVDDLSAVMQAGLRALIGASEDGRDTTAAAVTLWREFHAGREAVCNFLLPPSEAV